MNPCPELDTRLDAYVDGALDPAEHREVDAHLEGCEGCRETVRGLRTLRAAAEALPSSMEPSRDLWPGIRAELERPASGSWRPSWAVLAAAAVLLVAATAAVTTVIVRGGAPREPVGLDDGLALARSEWAGQALRTTEIEYLRATGELLDELRRRRSGLPPETARVLEENLRIIDDALVRAREALARDPDNVGLGEIYAAVYQRKVDLLEQANRL